jgi:hypothetical protein
MTRAFAAFVVLFVLALAMAAVSGGARPALLPTRTAICCTGNGAKKCCADSIAIAAGGKELFQQHRDGLIWHYDGTPCGAACPGWNPLDDSRVTVRIAAAALR